MTCVCVIGAGLGGLALAIRLQSSGIETTLLEAHSDPGGQWRSMARDGFTFDSGPAALAESGAVAELWQLAGGDMAEHITLLPLELLHRFNWPDGAVLDVAPSAPAGLGRSLEGSLKMLPVTKSFYVGQTRRCARAVHRGSSPRGGILPVCYAAPRCWPAIRHGDQPMALPRTL
jgi:phytoene dehydrogenase-like protein